jgi:hypothetical protein
VYRGALGQTRKEVHPVCMEDGSQRAMPLYVGVDAEADPALAALALGGELHGLEDGSQLAVPFVYHDARLPIFVLVVPAALRHRVLALRAELLTRLAADGEAHIPAYVAAAHAVVGAAGLRAHLAEDDDDLSALEVDDGELDELPEDADMASDSGVAGLGTSAALGRKIEASLGRVEAARESLPVTISLRDLNPADEIVRALGASRLLAEALQITNEADGVEYARASDVEALDQSGQATDPSREGAQVWLDEDDERVWLYVRGRPNAERARGEVDVLVQRDLRSTAFLLSVVFDVDGSPEVRRGIVDPHIDADRRALERLAAGFELELVDVGPFGQEHWGTLYAPREANIAALLTWVDGSMRATEPAGELERARLLAAPPPWRDLAHPFQRNAQKSMPSSATEAAVALDELALWLAPDRLAHLRLDLSVPDELIGARSRDVLANALDFGLALEPSLITRAVELGVCPSPRSVLERRILGLCRTAAEPDFGGLSDDVLRTLWSEVLEQAPQLGVTLPPKAEAEALRHAGERALIHARALAPREDDALLRARARLEAGENTPELLTELVTQGGLHDVARAMRRALPQGEVLLARLFARLSARDDAMATDAAQALLAAGGESWLRIGAALTLAAHEATSVIPALVRCVAEGDEAEARAVAVVLGRFGAGSVRSVARAFSGIHAPFEREAWTYAALVHHGARAQVRARARSHIAAEAQLAERALALANSLKEAGNPFVGLEQQGLLTVFFGEFDQARRAVADGDHGGVDSAALVP